MKKPSIIFFIIGLTALTVPQNSFAGTSDNAKTTAIAFDRENERNQVNMLIFRLNEIKDMDKSTMGASEKSAMRKEVRSIRKRLSEIHGGLYLSVGAIIIILLLLILLL